MMIYRYSKVKPTIRTKPSVEMLIACIKATPNGCSPVAIDVAFRFVFNYNKDHTWNNGGFVFSFR